MINYSLIESKMTQLIYLTEILYDECFKLYKEIDKDVDRYTREYQKLQYNIDNYGLSIELIQERNRLFQYFTIIHYNNLKYKRLTKQYLKFRLRTIQINF